MNSLTQDYIAIDTNVFMHLFNPKNNTKNHIDKLLSLLAKDKIKLLVDKDNKKAQEYNKSYIIDEYGPLRTYLKNKNNFREGDTLNKKTLLEYWIEPENYKTVAVNLKDPLMGRIKSIMQPPHIDHRQNFCLCCF